MPIRHAALPQPSSLPRAPSASLALAAWAHGLRLEHIPPHVVRHAKRMLLDTLAVAWAGAEAAGVAPVHAWLADQGGKPEASMWPRGGRLPAPAAALANGLSAAALDYDSVHDEATMHPDIILVPALLALAEREGCSGAEFLQAYVAGSEMLVRLGLGVKENPGWFLSSVLGGFAAAAAAARLLGLDAGGMHRAMGVCLSRASGAQQPLVEGSFTKRLQPAFAARDGVEAALLAQCGATSPARMFEGSLAFETLYVRLAPARILDALGETYHCTGLTLKDFPSCFCNHAAILAARDLYERAGVRAHDIETCEVGLTAYSARLVGQPFDPGDSPQVAAQFSAQYSLASVFLRGGLGIADIQPAAVREPRALELARRIRVRVLDGEAGKFTPAVVTVQTRDGRRLRSAVERIPGTPAAPFGDAQVRAKAERTFAGCRPAMARERVASLIQRIDNLEHLADMRAFLQQ